MDEQTQLRLQLQDILKETLNAVVSETEELLQAEIERPRRVWVRKWITRRPSQGASYQLFTELSFEDTTEYYHAIRMTEESFNILLNLVTPAIQKLDTIMRPALPAKVKLHSVLYLMAHGVSLRCIQHLFRLPKSTTCQMMGEVCDAIYNALSEFIEVPSDESQWKKIEEGFRNKWNFPRCCGAIDGKHIVIKAPSEAGSYYYNYKHQNSIVLMAVVDDDYKFTYIDVGCNGRVSDGGVYQRCSLSTQLESMLPANHCIVGDNAFPLKTYLMKPYAESSTMTTAQKVFNYRLSRARRIVENAFGILVSRFRIFERPIPFNPEKTVKIVKSCCALHNWLRFLKRDDSTLTIDREDTNTGQVTLGNWRDVPSEGIIPLSTNNSNHSAQRARHVRDNYAAYFVGDGSVSWQLRMVH